ncbi:MAG TPA: acetylxylan esterase [Lacipirellula sp.]
MSTALNAAYPTPDELPRKEKLPDPLVAFDRSKITTPDEWTAKRKPELKALFEHYMYGKYPETPQPVTAKVLFEDSEALGGKATLKEVELTTGPAGWPKIYLLIAAPPGGRSPCFVGANFGGNHLLTDHPRVRIPTAWMPSRYPGVVKGRATAAKRGAQADTWPLEEIIRRGYAVATFYCGDVQPDRPDEPEGLRAALATADGAGEPSHTATIMSWAWGIHRAVDHLASEPSIDPQRIAVVGHSRLGKTALLAGAFDDRIALTVANQAGVGGSGPSRHDDPKAESVARINSAFPHWFCDNFKQFGDDPSRLPFDQHSLVALCAPRPVLFAAAADDLWANPAGQFTVLKEATPVYELLGVEGLEADATPKPDAPLIDSRLGYWIRSGKHAMTPADWNAYMDFADKWLRKK